MLKKILYNSLIIPTLTIIVLVRLHLINEALYIGIFKSIYKFTLQIYVWYLNSLSTNDLELKIKCINM